MSPSTVPDAVFTIWWAGLIITLVVFVPLAVYLLHRTWRSARSIQRYAAETLQAAGGIARNTAKIAALDTTIAVAGDMLVAAGAVERKLDTVATVLEERGQRGGRHAAGANAGHGCARGAGARGLPHRDRVGAPR